MAKRWYILAVVVGGLAAAGVWYWPAGPSWRSGPGAGEMHGFSLDGRILVTVDRGYDDNESRWPDPVLRRWDAATGRRLSRATLPCVERDRHIEVRTSGDGRTALVGERTGDPTPGTVGENLAWYLHDGITGQRRVGPIPGLEAVAYKAFSADGLWFCGLPRPADPKSPFTTSLGIYRVDTGELLLKTPEEDGLMAMPVGPFAPDGASVAFFSLRFEPKAPGPRAVIHILELPSGRERCRFEPQTARVDLQNWDGRFLQLKEYGIDSARDKRLTTVRIYDLGTDTIGEGAVDPLLSKELASGDSLGLIEAKGGPDWVAYFTSVAPAPPPTGLAGRTRSWLGLHRPAPPGQPVTVRIIDRATGATRYEIPRPVGQRYMVTPDGRRLACRGHGDGVEVWDLDPPSRWPGVLAAGVGGAIGVLALGRFRGKAARPEKMSAGRFPVDSPPGELIITKLPTK